MPKTDTHALVCVQVKPNPNGESQVEFTIICQACEPQEQTFSVAGHHLRPIVNMLLEILDEYPELSESDGRVIARSSRRSTAARPPIDPRRN